MRKTTTVGVNIEFKLPNRKEKTWMWLFALLVIVADVSLTYSPTSACSPGASYINSVLFPISTVMFILDNDCDSISNVFGLILVSYLGSAFLKMI